MPPYEVGGWKRAAVYGEGALSSRTQMRAGRTPFLHEDHFRVSSSEEELEEELDEEEEEEEKLPHCHCRRWGGRNAMDEARKVGAAWMVALATSKASRTV